MNKRYSKEDYQSKLSSGEIYYDIIKWCKENRVNIEKMPFSIRILLENQLRHFDGKYFNLEYINRIGNWANKYESKEIPFLPSRILLQDLTGVPAVVDIAALRQAMYDMGENPEEINPQIPVDLVIDHSVSMDYVGTEDALSKNVELEFQRNGERYRFLKWAENNLDNFRVFAPGQGICHQVNLERIAKVVSQEQDMVFPDTLVGTDSHTTMVNGLGVLGWGVGGIEAEAAMLGQPIYMLNPEVIGVRLIGEINDDITATDIVLYLTNLLRQVGVVGKFVEYFGAGAEQLTVPNRATIANMSPEYGATMGFFPTDYKTLEYLRLTGRSEAQINLVEQYCKANGLFREVGSPEPEYTKVVEVDLSQIRPAVAGPKRPQDWVDLVDLKSNFIENYDCQAVQLRSSRDEQKLFHGDVVLAAITSCTNTSNPEVILGAGLLAKKAVKLGLKVPSYVKTSFAPGSLAVTEYLKKAGLLTYLEKLGFHVAGYGCATCIGNSGTLTEEVSKQIKDKELQVVGILSGNRNFEGRIHPLIPANYLASPILVVAFALAGRVIDLTTEAIGVSVQGEKIYFKDICPSRMEIQKAIDQVLCPEVFSNHQSAFSSKWNDLSGTQSPIYQWEEDSTYVRLPHYFDQIISDYKSKKNRSNSFENQRAVFLEKAKILGILGDSVTTDHISPAGSIALDSPAAKYLSTHQIKPQDFNSYGSRRGNHEVMMRGTFANIRLKNQMAEGKVGGFTKKDDEIMWIYDGAMEYKNENTPLIMIAGKEYGTGSSRDWAAKGPFLLGIKAVIAESFERIHRSNLLGMGILPIQFKLGDSAQNHQLTGQEEITIKLPQGLIVNGDVEIVVRDHCGKEYSFMTTSRLDNEIEIEYFLNGGILNTVLKNKIRKSK